MRTQTAILAAVTAFALSSSAWADGGPTPEPPPPPPPPPPADEPAAPPPAEPSHNDFVMVLNLGVGWSWVDEGTPIGLDDDSFPLIEGSGRANVPLSEDWALQLDAGGLSTFGDRDGGEDYLQTVYFAAAHLNYRQPEYALGILSQVGSSNGGDDENANFYNFGGEGLYNWTDFTLLGQAGYFWADDETENDVMTDAWWVRGIGRFYTSPDTRVQFEGSYADGEENDTFGGPDVTAIGWGGRIDHSFTGGPVALFLSYGGNFIENDGFADNNITEHTVMAGVRVHFGDAGSLKESDRNGPSFDTPDIGRWTGWTISVVD